MTILVLAIINNGTVLHKHQTNPPIATINKDSSLKVVMEKMNLHRRPISHHTNTSPPKQRRRLSRDETEYLLDRFHEEERPTAKARQLFAKDLNLDARTIQVWFQNRRAKMRKDASVIQNLRSVDECEQDESVESDEVGADDTENNANIVRSLDDDGEATRGHRSRSKQGDIEHPFGEGTETFLGFVGSPSSIDFGCDDHDVSWLSKMSNTTQQDVVACAKRSSSVDLNSASTSQAGREDEDGSHVDFGRPFCDILTMALKGDGGYFGHHQDEDMSFLNAFDDGGTATSIVLAGLGLGVDSGSCASARGIDSFHGGGHTIGTAMSVVAVDREAEVEKEMDVMMRMPPKSTDKNNDISSCEGNVQWVSGHTGQSMVNKSIATNNKSNKTRLRRGGNNNINHHHIPRQQMSLTLQPVVACSVDS
ncbi:hypothetical protein BGZ94_006612 [Podila epigama]|nr:hypothetical protein BGZ94_006612 [Podila epigama]